MNGFPLFPTQASTIAPEVDALYIFLLLVAGFFTLLIFLLIVFFGIKYRRRSASDRPPAVADNMALELTWTAIPVLLAMVIFAWGAKLFVRATRVPPNAMEISVVGKQWMWKVQHPEGRREINELHVPVGRPIELHMTSQDVIHDFSVPAFRVKRDVLPGRYTTEWFEPTLPGEYHLFCSQYCGADHAHMVGTVYVMEPAAYEAWLVGVSGDEAPAVSGARLFAQYSCNTCHGQRAPTLANLYGSKVRMEDGSVWVADDNYLRESIVNPRAKIVAGYPPLMPTYKGLLSEEQINDLIAYIKSLGNGIPSGGDAAGAAPPNAVGNGPSVKQYLTQTPLPNQRSVLPTSGPAGPDGASAPGQDSGAAPKNTAPATK